MPKKQSTKKRTQVKDLPKKAQKLSAKDMKKVKGGGFEMLVDDTKGLKSPTKPPTIK
ncbi:MAG: hypothetical protein H7Y30_05430 [Pyrinomonadaceae bacterium]|nr:hypothetical protein [Pyrinomonadaceae bacterium]